MMECPRLAARAKTPANGESAVIWGFSALEITLPLKGGPAEEGLWHAMAASGRVQLLAHGPEEGDPMDPDRLRRQYLPRLREALDQAGRLGCPGLTVHCWMDARFLPEEARVGKARLLAEISAEAASRGLWIGLENLSESADDLEPILDAAPDLMLTLDVGHAQLLSPCNRAPEIIRRLGHRLRHLHLHDNKGGDSPRDDLHLPPGQGTVPFVEIFRALAASGYNGHATLELEPPELTAARDWVLDAWGRAVGAP